MNFGNQQDLFIWFSIFIIFLLKSSAFYFLTIFIFRVIRNTISKILRHNNILCLTAHTIDPDWSFTIRLPLISILTFIGYLQFAFFRHTNDLSPLMVL